MIPDNARQEKMQTGSERFDVDSMRQPLKFAGANMSSRPASVVLAVLLSVTVIGAPQGRPQPQKPAEPPQQPTFRTEANFVRVDVFATTRGKPIDNLQLADFEILEDGVPQKISTFEYVHVRAGTPQELRTEPNTIRDANEALKNPRARVFVLFLDVPHVSIDGAWHAREPLIRLVDRLMGEEDLVGIMTPRMAASDMVFARKTQVLQGGLRDRWPWGERHTLQRDELEELYRMCYPWRGADDLIRQMIARKRERATLESLFELVNWLRYQRDERKAVLTVSEGWRLYQPDPKLTAPVTVDSSGGREPVPGPDPIGVDPFGKLTRSGKSNSVGVTKSECDADRDHLSRIDDEQFMKDLIDAANRANASFYTIDPRGLPVFDTPIGPDPPAPTPLADMMNLKDRHESLHMLSNNTDGFAVLNSNNLDPGLKRISDDLSSYYLLGYHSTNTKLDGKYRTLRVKVKRPDVDVRARRGYKAATAAEITVAREAAAPPVSAATSATRTAMESLARIRSGAPVYAHAAVLKGPPAMVWVTGELSQRAAAAVTGIVTISTPGATNSAEITVDAGRRGFTAAIPLRVVPDSPVDVRVRIAAAEGPALTDAVRVNATSGISAPLMFRRGPVTGNRQEPAGLPQFSRTERARFESALEGDAKVSTAQILDGNGTPAQFPVTLTERSDAPHRWAVAEIILAALAPGDYVLEVSGTSAGQSQKVLTAFRVTR